MTTTIERMQQRRGTKTEWEGQDPTNNAIVLASGEIGFVKDTGGTHTQSFKIGDGILPWSDLLYQGLGNLTVDTPILLNLTSDKGTKLTLKTGETGGLQMWGDHLDKISALTGTGWLQRSTTNNVTSWSFSTPSNYYPTTFAWTDGTTAGPTGSLTGSGMSAVSYAAIPSAAVGASGIVTTGAQTFAGAKTFRNANTQDGIQIAGRNGGTSAFSTILTTGTLAASYTLTLPNPGVDDTIISRTTTDTLTNKSLSDTTTYIVDVTDTTKKLKFDIQGTTAITGTIATAFTTAKTVTIPDITGTLAINPTTLKGDIIYASAPTTAGTGTLSALPTPTAVGTYFLRENVTAANTPVNPDWLGSTGTGNVVLASAPTISGLVLSNTPTLANAATTLSPAMTIDASTAEMFAINGSFTTNSTLTIQNLAAGKKIVIAARNTGATGYSLTLNASATTTTGTTVFLQPTTPGAASVTAVTMAASTGTALITVLNIGGVFYGSI